jgi:GDSL-like Lipase/Acylhydrolase family
MDNGHPPSRPSAPSVPRARTLSRSRRVVFGTTIVLFVLLFAEGVSWLGIWMLPGHDFRRTTQIFEDQSRSIRQFLSPNAPRMIEIHSRLGWRYAAHFTNATNQLNSMALRSTREYADKPASRILRIAAFGDSYVYGSEVDNPNAWAGIMEAQDPHLEVLNYGVGGYGIDQAYLRYALEGSELHPQVVMMGFTTDDIGRVVNVFRPFIDSRDAVLFKPRFLISDRNELTLLESPVQSLRDYERLLVNPRDVLGYSEHDYWYRANVYENSFYDYSAAVRFGCWLWTRAYRQQFDPEGLFKGGVFSTTSTAFRLNLALLSRFAQSVQSAGALPIVVMLPNPADVRAVRTGNPSRYEPLLQQLQQHQIPCLDAASAFRNQTPESDDSSWFAPQGHYSAAGNKIVASWLRLAIHEYLERSSRQTQ